MISKVTATTHGNEETGASRVGHRGGDTAAAPPKRRWRMTHDMLILGVSLLAVGITWANSQGMEDFSSVAGVSSSPVVPVEPVIRAWHPWDVSTVPVGQPERDQQDRWNQRVAILAPTGVQVIAFMHQEEYDLSRGSTFATAPEQPSWRKNRMPTSTRILVAVDQSEASRRAVRYVAAMVGGKPDVHVGLLHLELPPRMLEWGGSEDPQLEDKMSSERAHAYQEMEKEAIVGGQALLQGLQGILAERGIDVAAQMVQFEEPLDPKHITHHILATAKERDYGTVVMGQKCFSGLKRLFRHHVGEEIIRVHLACGQRVTAA
jgi:nucleotide-binding universal stress UspA family protein